MVERRAEPDAPSRNAMPIPPRHRVPAHLARRLHQIFLGVAAEVIEPAGIAPGDYSLLAAIQDLPNLDQRSIADHLGIDPVNAGGMIDRLEAGGLVQRCVHPADRRARLVNATPAGIALRERLRPAALAAQDAVMAPLAPEERVIFLDLLTRIIEGNQAYARPGNGRRRPQRKIRENRNDGN